MQEDLWGDEFPLIQRKPKRATSKEEVAQVTLTTSDCVFFGHAFQVVGLSGEKQYTVCGEKGYCPVCTPVAPKGANPYYCTKHTPGEVKVQA